MYKSGANFRDRNEIVRLHAEGFSVEKIRALTKVNDTTIQNIIDELDEAKLAEIDPEDD